VKIELHPSAPEDRPWLEELRRVVYLDLFIATWGGWDEDRHQRHWAAFLENGNIFMIKVDGVDAGMVQILEQQEAIEIAEIQILPAYQRRGIGRQVIRDVVSKAHSNRKAATLSVGLKNSRAIKLYRSLGFTEVGKTEAKLYFELPPSP
jgi:ribosomal protein S18 acetylase RimI-like enzyme